MVANPDYIYYSYHCNVIKTSALTVFPVIECLESSSRYARYNWSDPKYAVMAAMQPSDTENFLRNGAHPLFASILNCTYASTVYDCADVFDVVTTEGGEYLYHPYCI